MKLTKSTVASAFSALLIGGLGISQASAGVNENGRVYTGSKAGFELNSDSVYNIGRVAPKGKTEGVLTSNAAGRTNGRQG